MEGFQLFLVAEKCEKCVKMLIKRFKYNQRFHFESPIAFELKKYLLSCMVSTTVALRMSKIRKSMNIGHLKTHTKGSFFKPSYIHLLIQKC